MASVPTLMMNELSPEQQKLALQIASEAERQLIELYDTPASREAVAKSGIDERPPEQILAKQYATIKEILNRDVEDLLCEITPKLGICSEEHPIYQKWDGLCEVAKTPLASYLISLIGIVFPPVGSTALLASIVVIISFYGLDRFCERYGSN